MPPFLEQCDAAVVARIDRGRAHCQCAVIALHCPLEVTQPLPCVRKIGQDVVPVWIQGQRHLIGLRRFLVALQSMQGVAASCMGIRDARFDGNREIGVAQRFVGAVSLNAQDREHPEAWMMTRGTVQNFLVTGFRLVQKTVLVNLQYRVEIVIDLTGRACHRLSLSCFQMPCPPCTRVPARSARASRQFDS